MSNRRILPVTHRDLLPFYQSAHDDHDDLIAFLSRHLKTNPDDTDLGSIKHECARLKSKFLPKWKKASRHLERFLSNNVAWLACNITFPEHLLKTEEIPTPRRALPFAEKGLRSQQLQIAKVSGSQTEETVPL